ncbi:MAG: FMN-binding protein [Deltaproteobacteria bacterium]|nr:FMN-binding protein [Deltaproteobacteria bacterium]
MNENVATFIVMFAVVCFGSIAWAQKIYLTPVDALKLMFKKSSTVSEEKHAVSLELRQKLEKENRIPFPKNTYTFYVGKSGEKIDGYALIDEEIGKVEPITFVTLISPEGIIQQVEIMVYRESHGGEVAQLRFLNQFRGKTLVGDLRLNQGIRSITGATLSAKALVTGTRRALILWQNFYGK